GRPVCWGVALHPDKELAVGMLERLVAAVRPTEARPLVVHTDGGAVYMSDDWAGACASGNVARSMSRKARSPDNARCEGFFGTPESDFFEGEDWTGVTFEEFRERLDAYIEWYRDAKPKKSLGWRTTAEYRRDLGYGYTLAA
ncbi:transposase, partial [Atopobiaceae bacterium HCP3S3_D6]